MKFKTQQANDAYMELIAEVNRCVADLTQRADKAGGREGVELLGKATEAHIQGYAVAIQTGMSIDKGNAESVIGAQILAHAMGAMGRD